MVGFSSQKKEKETQESKKCLSNESELIIWDLPKSKDVGGGIVINLNGLVGSY